MLHGPHSSITLTAQQHCTGIAAAVQHVARSLQYPHSSITLTAQQHCTGIAAATANNTLFEYRLPGNTFCL